LYRDVYCGLYCDLYCDVYCGLYCDVYCGLYCDVYCDLYCDVYCGLYCDVYCDLYCGLYSRCVKTIFWLAGRPLAVQEDPVAWSQDVRAVLVVRTWDVNITGHPYDKTNHLVLFREIITVCSEISVQPINILYRQNLEFANVKPGGKESYHQ